MEFGGLSFEMMVFEVIGLQVIKFENLAIGIIWSSEVHEIMY